LLSVQDKHGVSNSLLPVLSDRQQSVT